MGVAMVDKRTLGTGYLIGTGTTLNLVLLVRLLSLDSMLSLGGIGTASGLLLAVSLVYAGFWVDHTDLEDLRVWTITQWSATGLAVLTVASVGLLVASGTGVRGATGGTTLLANVAAGGVAGVLVGTVAEFRDEQRRTAQLNRRNLVLNRVLRHNIRNETNIILGHAGDLADDLDGDPADRAELIRGKAANITRLGKKARQIERALAPERDVYPVEVGEMTAEAIAAIRADHPRAKIDAVVPDGVWGLADDMLPIVVENLLENAVEHTSKHVDISLTVEARSDAVAITVSDTGPGIPAQEMEVLQRDHETPLDHGSGLGLRLVQWLVERYDGAVHFSNREPRGTTVTVELIACPPPEDAPG